MASSTRRGYRNDEVINIICCTRPDLPRNEIEQTYIACFKFISKPVSFGGWFFRDDVATILWAFRKTMPPKQYCKRCGGLSKFWVGDYHNHELGYSLFRDEPSEEWRWEEWLWVVNFSHAGKAAYCELKKGAYSTNKNEPNQVSFLPQDYYCNQGCLEKMVIKIAKQRRKEWKLIKKTKEAMKQIRNHLREQNKLLLNSQKTELKQQTTSLNSWGH